MQDVNLRLFRKSSLKSRRSLRSFLTKTENNPPRGLHGMVQHIDQEVWAETNCLSCANCCKKMSPTYTLKDIKRISSHLYMTVKEFKKKWLYFDKKEEDWMNVSRPCQFLDLKSNMCSIYEVRPKDCAGFPHLTKKHITDYMHVHRQSLEYCPATLKMVEKLREKIMAARSYM